MGTFMQVMLERQLLCQLAELGKELEGVRKAHAGVQQELEETRACLAQVGGSCWAVYCASTTLDCTAAD